MAKTIAFELNGNRMELEVQSHWTLLDLLREHLEMSGSKSGCEVGECGACTVLVNGKAVNACLFPAMEAEGAQVLTIEGLAKPSGELHPLQKAFVEHGGVQCGFCTPGMIMNAISLLLKDPESDRDKIIQGMDRNLCRCGAHVRIIQAIESAARKMREAKQS